MPARVRGLERTLTESPGQHLETRYPGAILCWDVRLHRKPPFSRSHGAPGKSAAPGLDDECSLRLSIVTSRSLRVLPALLPRDQQY